MKVQIIVSVVVATLLVHLVSSFNTLAASRQLNSQRKTTLLTRIYAQSKFEQNLECMTLGVDDIRPKNEQTRYISIGMPKVIAPNKPEEDYLMWFHARDSGSTTEPNNIIKMSTGRIIFLSSKDGINNWSQHEDSPVMNPDKEDGNWFTFDSEHIGLGDVIQPGYNAQSKFTDQGNVFLMYTFGGNVDTSVDPTDGSPMKGAKLEIGVAVSRDGAHWSRIEGPNPYGAIIEIGEKETDFDKLFVGWPSVVEKGSSYYMYYNTYDASKKKWVVALAEAPDGLLKWNKRGVVFSGLSGGEEGSFDEFGATRRHVLTLPDGTLRMYYEGVSSGQRSIGVAVSLDGLKWEKAPSQSGPVFSANTDPNAWDAGGVGSPHLVWLPEKNRWRMYYIGTAMGQSSLGMGMSGSGSGGGDSIDSIKHDSGLPDSVLDGSTGIGIAESTDETGMHFERIK